MIQASFTITGKVQGVGYRAYVKSKARKLGLTGWVQNLPNGKVEALVQGEKERIAMLIQDCNRGSYLAEVTDLEVLWQEVGERFDTFTIRKLS